MDPLVYKVWVLCYSRRNWMNAQTVCMFRYVTKFNAIILTGYQSEAHTTQAMQATWT